MIMTGPPQVVDRPGRIKPGIKRPRKPRAPSVKPHRGRSRQDANAMIFPDRRPVCDSFRIMPHPVRIDKVSSGILYNTEHSAVDVLRHAPQHVGRGCPEVGRPVPSDKLEVAADASGSDNYRLCTE